MAGLVLLVVGIVIGFVGSVLVYTCTTSFFGSCLEYGYRGLGIVIGGIGVALFVAGIVLVALGFASATGVQMQTLGLPPPMPPPAPLQAFPDAPACPVCMQPLRWIDEKKKWFCLKCGEYR